MTLAVACPNHHEVAAGASFCGMCGSPLEFRDPSGPFYAPPPTAFRPLPYRSAAAIQSSQFGYEAHAAEHYGDPYAPQVQQFPGWSTQTNTQAQRRRRGLLLVVAAVVILAIAGAGAYLLLSRSDAPANTTVTGEFELVDAETAANGCVGTGGYDDIQPGATVILYNQDNKILGSTGLEAGNSVGGTCTYSFSIDAVSMSEAQYAIEVTHRGKVVSSRAELAKLGWAFSLTMGS